MIYHNSDDLHHNLRNLNRDPFVFVDHCLLDGVDPGVRIEVGSFVLERVFPFSDADLADWIDDLGEALESAVSASNSRHDAELLALIEAAGV